MRVKIILDDLIKSGKYVSKGGVNPYRNFLKLMIKIVTGKCSNQIKRELGLNKGDSVFKHFSKDELRKLDIVDNQISKLLEKGNLTYKDIKNMNLIIY